MGQRYGSVLGGQRNVGCGKERASQGETFRITNCQKKKKKKFKEEENSLKETGKAKEDQKNLIAWPPASDAK